MAKPLESEVCPLVDGQLWFWIKTVLVLFMLALVLWRYRSKLKLAALNHPKLVVQILALLFVQCALIYLAFFVQSPLTLKQCHSYIHKLDDEANKALDDATKRTVVGDIQFKRCISPDWLSCYDGILENPQPKTCRVINSFDDKIEVSHLRHFINFI